MHAIQLVSIDLFETLVDASAGRHALWQTFLGGTSTHARIEQAWTLTTQRLFASLDQIIAASTYQPLHAVFQACYMKIFAHLQVVFDPGEAARMAVRYHAQSPWFPAAVPCLEAIRRRYPLCLASDADEAMVGEHVRSDFLAFSIYVDAEERHLQQWYIERFLQLRDTAVRSPTASVRRYAGLSIQETTRVATYIWRDINSIKMKPRDGADPPCKRHPALV